MRRKEETKEVKEAKKEENKNDEVILFGLQQSL